MIDTLTPAVTQFSDRLQASLGLHRERYEQLWNTLFEDGRGLVVGQAEYVLVHKRRFHELFNAVALLQEGVQQPHILEFGASEFSGGYRRLWPHVRLDLADRPTAPESPGFTEAVARRISGCERYFVLDLETPGVLRAHPELPQRDYDVVVFAEVIEHLVVNPVELLSGLLGLLKPEGTIYLTTPNFFSRKNRRLMKQGENPQPVYPPAGGNWDAHYHHREFCAKEMLRFIEQAGGQLTGFYFSDCWDTQKKTGRRTAALRPEERGNMVFTFRQARSRVPD